jgi:galactonate dehydratase
MATSELTSLKGATNGHYPAVPGQTLAKIKTVEYFRVKPRWLFVKICDDQGNHGWGEATLEGHTRAVEGALDEIVERIVGLEAEYVMLCPDPWWFRQLIGG